MKRASSLANPENKKEIEYQIKWLREQAKLRIRQIPDYPQSETRQHTNYSGAALSHDSSFIDETQSISNFSTFSLSNNRLFQWFRPVRRFVTLLVCLFALIMVIRRRRMPKRVPSVTFLNFLLNRI